MNKRPVGREGSCASVCLCVCASVSEGVTRNLSATSRAHKMAAVAVANAAAPEAATPANAMERFGAPGGVPIDNLDTILSEVDRALGRDSAPAVEYLFVSPFHSHNVFGLSLGSPFGHAALRYTLPDGRSIVMNIIKNSTDKEYMVNFIPANEYLYGNRSSHTHAHFSVRLLCFPHRSSLVVQGYQ